jgi:hypothetical protein
MLAWVDAQSMRDQEDVLLISRLPHRRLVDHIHIEKVEVYWLTERDEIGTLSPELDNIRELLVQKVNSGEGLAVIEGLEWLISTNGFDEVINFTMEINDILNSTSWRVIYTFDTGILSAQELARFHKEAEEWNIPDEVEIKVIEDDNEISEFHGDDIAPDEHPVGLAFLVRIPREGFTKDILRRRVLQWRRMGLEVSEVEPALFMDSLDNSFELYYDVESKVRKAIELDNRLDILLEKGYRSEVTKMIFRVRQLTGFSDVERRIDELI